MEHATGSDPAQRHRSIREIAFANGSNNPSHFTDRDLSHS
jgi:hypothetical protein